MSRITVACSNFVASVKGRTDSLNCSEEVYGYELKERKKAMTQPDKAMEAAEFDWTPYHIAPCNYSRKPLGYPGCICAVVSKYDPMLAGAWTMKGESLAIKPRNPNGLPFPSEPSVPVSELAIRKAAQACWGAVPFICASEDFFYDRIKEALKEYPVLPTAALHELEMHANTQNSFQGCSQARRWVMNTQNNESVKSGSMNQNNE